MDLETIIEWNYFEMVIKDIGTEITEKLIFQKFH